jgi:hypothetical protein
MEVTNQPSDARYPVDSNNYNVMAVKNNLKNSLHHFTHSIEHLIQNPDQINEQNLQDLAESIKDLKKYSDLAGKAPNNTDLGQTLCDSSTIINNALEAPIDA